LLVAAVAAVVAAVVGQLFAFLLEIGQRTALALVA
jgi:hypothetical protein